MAGPALRILGIDPGLRITGFGIIEKDVISNDDGSVEVVSEPGDFEAVRNALNQKGLKPELAEITMKPVAENVLKGDEASRMQRLLDALEGLDDVQDVYTTAVMD